MEQLTVVRECLQTLPIELVLIERMLSCTTAFERMSPARTDALEDHIDSNGQTVEDKTIDQVPRRHNGVNLLNLLGCLMKYFRQSRYSREVDVCCERGEHSCIHGERHDKPLVLAREDGIGWLMLMLLLFQLTDSFFVLAGATEMTSPWSDGTVKMTGAFPTWPDGYPPESIILNTPSG